MKRTFLSLGLLTLLLPLAACRSAGTPAQEAPAPEKAGPVKVTMEEVGLSQEAMDPTADPCNDFYRYACGGWLDATEIPADRPVWSRGFNTIYEQNLKLLHQILEDAAAAENPDPLHRKIGDFYSACMNEEAISAQGLEGAAPLLKPIASMKNRQDLSRVLTQLHAHRVWAGFDVAPDQSYDDATKVMAFIDQNGLGLPDRDYYTRDDDESVKLRDRYQQHVATMLELAGWDEVKASKAAKNVLALETKLAKASQTKVERREPDNLWHPMDIEALRDLAPSFPWPRYLDAQGLGDVATVNVINPQFLKTFNQTLEETPLSTWKAYLTFHVLGDLAGADALPKPFVDEQFQMAQALTGTPQQPERWKRCVRLTDGALGELLGQAYVDQAFAGESKSAAEQMVNAIGEAFGNNLSHLDWMDEATRTKAREKLENLNWKIGYPDVWRKYPFEVDPEAHAANVLAAQAAEMDRLMAQVGAPLDPHEWHMSPPTVNAYYSPSRNEMVFPAGILQSPFYDVNAATAVNLGGIGMVMGHELTHGFDDEGSQFDAHGNVKNWWSEASGEAFEGRGQCVVDKYAQYRPLPDLPLNGDLTLGENIADIGGLKIAFDAYRSMRDGDRPLVANGFDEDQMFFLGFAQSWCSEYRDEIMRLLVQTDPHSPPEFRVNGSLPNVPAFAEAFQCEQGTAMNPPDRCDVW